MLSRRYDGYLPRDDGTPAAEGVMAVERAHRVWTFPIPAAATGTRCRRSTPPTAD